MPLEIKPIQVQSKFPLEKKPSLDPAEKEIYSDVFSLQNAFKILFLVLDNTFTKVQDYVNAGGGGGGIPEAPVNGTTYGRKNAAWESVATGGGGSATSGAYTLESFVTVAAGNTGFTIALTDTEFNAYEVEISSSRPGGGAASSVISLQYLTGAAVPSTEVIFLGRIDGAVPATLGTSSPGILKFGQTQNNTTLEQISSIRLSFGITGRAVSCETRTAFWENSTVSDTTCLTKATGIKFAITGETQWTHQVSVFARNRTTAAAAGTGSLTYIAGAVYGFHPGFRAQTTAVQAQTTADNIRGSVIIVPHAGKFKVGWRCASFTTAVTLRAGLYARRTTSSWLPGTLVTDLGSLVFTATGLVQTSAAVNIPAGVYVLVIFYATSAGTSNTYVFNTCTSAAVVDGLPELLYSAGDPPTRLDAALTYPAGVLPDLTATSFTVHTIDQAIGPRLLGSV